MDNTALQQLYRFLVFVASGLCIGIIFDVFRILRKSFKTTDLVTSIEDILFWIITGILILYNIFRFNNGEIRSYLFLGILVGVTCYLIFLSKLFIRINVAILKYIKKFVRKVVTILLYPFRIFLSFIRKVVLKPISFIFINVRKNIKNEWNKINTTIKKKKIKSTKKEKKDDIIPSIKNESNKTIHKKCRKNKKVHKRKKDFSTKCRNI